MSHSARLLRSLTDGGRPFAIIRRQDAATLDVLVGDVADVDRLDDIPLDGEEVLALVPFRQVRERGFAAHDDGAPLRCLIVRERETLDVETALDVLPAAATVTDVTVDIDDDAYARVVRRVIDEEIGAGEGANFVIRRDFRARTQSAPAPAVLGWLRELLLHERGAYWSFAVHTPGVSLVGATPERHVSVRDGLVTMNPISGTFRHPEGTPTPEAILDFLADEKERDELVMVVDEELKMMSSVCPDGGRMRGPFLKRMSKLTHTEYALEGRSDLDPREVLRRTMFAPTVTGSPMGNACTVIARHESSGRGYYAAVLARFTPKPRGYDLDAPILIRTAHLDDSGRVRVPVGATLVRHSRPESEVAETHAKAAGVLTALGVLPRANASIAAPAEDPRFAAVLAARNDALAPFWSTAQAPRPATGASALVIDAGDDFTRMLAHQLNHLGVAARVADWSVAPDDPDEDLVVFGPGPGDPRREEPRLTRLRELLSTRLESARPLLAVCLSHQLLAQLAGLEVRPLPEPRQGVQHTVDLAGAPARIGFYNTFAAYASSDSSPLLDFELSRDPGTGAVHGLRRRAAASVQGQLESVLSPDGLATLTRLVEAVMVPEGALVPTQ
ncbi:phenazine biosynthesis protein phzE [Paramicrobacterium humi]|uniref:anthranilate synthase n=1 Tax=Paramicrobacterium humi TaxID=640635 RepID=A0A1H4T390_9MICO|nr:anthranilate synthase family protein [Microbacterium humi]SEC50624.1 phenazine biosynthesis protein phzE [Microbacterium humi]